MQIRGPVGLGSLPIAAVFSGRAAEVRVGRGGWRSLQGV